MFDNLDWNVEARPLNSGKVGKVEITPDVVFTIRRCPKDRWEAGKYIGKGYYFSVGLEAYGCSTGKTFDTQAEVITYLEAQMTNVPQYEAIKAKRDAIGNRMKPLQAKWFQTGEQIFGLLEK